MAGSQRLCIPRQVLGPDDVHLWHVFVDQVFDATLLRELRVLLSRDEQAREGRFAHQRDRRQYFLARVLARTILSSYLGRPCDSLHFATTPYGKPVLPPSAGLAGIQFNLTHSHGAIACAVSSTREIGIDVEDAQRKLAYLELAERYFARPEAEHLGTLQGDARRAAFFSIWTLKEAYVKALGQGLTYPLDVFAFDLDGDRLRAFRALTPEVSSAWQFFQFQLGAHHRGAIAVQAPPGRSPANLHTFDWARLFLE